MMKKKFTFSYYLFICFSISTVALTAQSTLEPDYFLIGRDNLPENGINITDTLLFFDANKGAFRGGQLNFNNNWSPDSLGYFSFGYGSSVNAKGFISTALGVGTMASGDLGATALGANTKATGYAGATALGRNTIANGDHGATALGAYSTVSGNYGAAAIGYHTTTNGNNGAIALGYYTTTNGNSCTTLGVYNDPIVTPGTPFNESNPLLIIGNGNDENSSSNALVVRKRGDVGIGINNPEAWLHLRNTFLGDSSGIKITNAHTSGVFNSLMYNDTVGDLVLRKQIIPNQLVLGLNGRVGIGRKPGTNKLELEGEASKTTAGNWIGNSDRRLKKNITSIAPEQALHLLQQLQGVYFEWNDTVSGYSRPEGQQMGFIAQEIQEVFPEKVSQDAQGYYQTAYGDYDALFVQGFKALVQEMSQVKDENADLKR